MVEKKQSLNRFKKFYIVYMGKSIVFKANCYYIIFGRAFIKQIKMLFITKTLNVR